MPKNIALTEPPFRNVIVKSMMPLPCLTGSRPAGPRAFSLLELMTALAILAVLAMLSASGWSGWMRSQSLTQAGMKVTGLLDLARQTALTRNTTSALVVLTGGQASVRDRTLRVMYYDTDADQWTALTGWEALPFDIVVAEGEGSPTPPALLSQLDYRGEAAPACRCHIFLPGGQLLDPDNGEPALVLEENRPGTPANRIRVQINPLNGQTRVVRP